MSADPNTGSLSSKPNATTGTVKVWLESGIIHQQLTGDQTGETVAEVTRQTELIVGQLQAKQEPVLILSNFTEVGDQTQEARDELRNTLGTRYFDRIAVFGVPTRLQIVARLLLTLTGKEDQIRIFSSQEDGEAWLREFRPSF